jgi:hypothetical protein
LVGVDFTQNCSFPTNKTIQIVLSIVFITHIICGFTHSNSYINYIHTFFLLQLLFPYLLNFVLSLIIKIYDKGLMIHLKYTIVSK